MPVKQTLIILLASLFTCGCGDLRRSGGLECRDIVLSQSRAGSYTSLFDSGDALTAVYSNWESGSLSIVDVPDSTWDRAGVPPASYLRPGRETDFSDKIDEAPIQSPDFGELTCAMIGSSLHVLYADRRNEERPILKLLSREGFGDWRVDVLEPPGRPVAVVQNTKGNTLAFWASGSLFADAPEESAGPSAVLSPFSPSFSRRAGEGSFTVFDLATNRLLCVSARGDGIRVRDVPGGHPVHGSILSPLGSLAVATFAPDAGRIFLLEQAGENEAWRKATVAFSEDTRSLFVARYGRGYLFVFDSVRRKGSGETSHVLYVLVPQGRRYERYSAWEGTEPIVNFSAVLRGKTLFVLAVRDRPELLRMEIP